MEPDKTDELERMLLSAGEDGTVNPVKKLKRTVMGKEAGSGRGKAAAAIACAVILVLLPAVSFFAGAALTGTDGMAEADGAASGALFDGFEALTDKTAAAGGADAQNGLYGADTKPETEMEGAAGSFYASALVKNADMTETVCQIGNIVITLPAAISEFEKNGMELITVGSLTPSEEETLQPKQRDGYLQYRDNIFYVRLANGEACTYHDLRVIGLACDTEDAPFISAGGFCVGDGEAVLLRDGASVGYNELSGQTFYEYGSLEGSSIMGNLTGKLVEYTVKDGMVQRIYLFDDGTVR